MADVLYLSHVRGRDGDVLAWAWLTRPGLARATRVCAGLN